MTHEAAPPPLPHMTQLILATFVTYQKHNASLSCDAISNLTGYSNPTVYRHLKELTISNLLICTERGDSFATNLYTLSESAKHTHLKRIPHDAEAFLEHTRLMRRLRTFTNVKGPGPASQPIQRRSQRA